MLKDFRNVGAYRSLRRKVSKDKDLSAILEYIDMLENQVKTLEETLERMRKRPLVEASNEKRLWFSVVLSASAMADSALEKYLIERRHEGLLDYFISEQNLSCNGNLLPVCQLDIYCLSSAYQDIKRDLARFTEE